MIKLAQMDGHTVSKSAFSVPKALATIGACLLVLATIITAPYIYSFYSWGLASTPSDFSDFASYFGPMLSVSISIATLVAAIYATVQLPRFLEATKRDAGRTRATLDLQKYLYSRDFFLNVVSPSWEIAVKWTNWRGPKGDAYRRDVCGGYFLYEDRDFTESADLLNQPYQNPIRFHGHHLPFGYDPQSSEGGGAIIKELSEHQVLNLWIHFWTNLEVLVSSGILDVYLVAKLFGEMYSYWLPFMQQFRFTGEELQNLQHTNLRELTILEDLTRLETRLFSVNELNDVTAVNKQKTKNIAERTLDLHNASRDPRT